MRKELVACLKPVLLPAIVMVSLTANAQKLPNVQQGSLHAPANVKVDGKATEWNSQFQAYNHTTGIYYTIANDAGNVYLTVQATDSHTIDKMLSGGITFTVKNTDKKNKAVPVNITFLYRLLSACLCVKK